MSEAERPNPDEILARMKRDETAASRGKLKIFFGMSPGVGKTYAMLQAARQKQAQGCKARRLREPEAGQRSPQSRRWRSNLCVAWTPAADAERFGWRPPRMPTRPFLPPGLSVILRRQIRGRWRGNVHPEPAVPRILDAGGWRAPSGTSTT